MKHGAIHSVIPGIRRLSEYTAKGGGVAAPPASVDWCSAVKSWPMYANDRLACCSAAMVGHCITAWTTAAGSPLVMPEAAVIDLYSQISGYVPGDASTDKGTSFATLLPYWKAGLVNTGLPSHPGDKIDAYCHVDGHDQDQIKDAINWFGGILCLLELPLSSRDQEIWDVPRGGPLGFGKPGSEANHFVPILGYDADGLTCVTWGAVRRMTWAFAAAYLGDAMAAVSRDFLTAAGTTPEGLSVDQMIADMAAVGNV